MTDGWNYDVVIIGGAFSGSAAGILLKRTRPDLDVLIVESRTEFDRKVGESTSDVTGCFLTRVLRIHDHLVNEHLPKQGLRFWFNSPGNDDPALCSEIGSFYQVRMPTFQLDRAILDEYLLSVAVDAGCELWRPARVKHAELGGVGVNVLAIDAGGRQRDVRAKWLIDASGKAAFLARKLGLHRPLREHPTNSMWVRYRGVRSLDGLAADAIFREPSDRPPCPRTTATNHLTGRGWWCWLIPLKGGDMSAGVTWDTRIFTPPEGGSIGDRLKRHLCSDPIGRFMFADAEPVENDARMYSQLPYYSEKVAGDGWAMVGDAAGFMDPLYSQGLDYCSHTVFAVHKIIGRSLEGFDVTTDIAGYEKDFQVSYRRWFHALYEDKYHYLGDAELMWVAFLLDLATYFLGPVRLVHSNPASEFTRLPYDGTIGRFFAWWMRLYNRRLAVIARKRHAAGCYGRLNLGRRRFVKQGFSPDLKVWRLLWRGLRAWAGVELKSVALRPRPQADSSNGGSACAPDGPQSCSSRAAEVTAT